MRALWLPQAFDHFDLWWEPVHDWQNWGDDTFDPRVGVDHHTAGAGIQWGDAPSLGVVRNGRTGLPGPLSETLQARSNKIHLIASGRANHAGLGGWKGYSGNSRAWGNERENVGTSAEPWRPDQHHTAARLHAAWIWGMQEFEGITIPPANICRHAEWAPDRKIDTHSFLGSELRVGVEAALAGIQPEPELPAPLEEDDMIHIYYAGHSYLLVQGRLVDFESAAEVAALEWGSAAAGRPLIKWEITSKGQWQRLVAMFGRPLMDPTNVTFHDGWATAPRTEV